MKRKLFAMLMAAAMIAGLTGCSGSSDKAAETDTKEEAASEAAEEKEDTVTENYMFGGYYEEF